MLDVLSDGFKKAKDVFQGKTTLTEANIEIALKEIRVSLLDADVEFSVTKEFLSQVKEKALGQEVKLKAGSGKEKLKVTAADHFVRICQEELEALMGPVESGLALDKKNGPSIVMMVGLQGTGKTTTTGKLARFFKTQKSKKPLLVAADIYRAAAVEQLKVLGRQIQVPVFHKENANPVEICSEAIEFARKEQHDVVFFDTAGRLTVDDELMDELTQIKAKTQPDNILLVCDAMMGQDAVTTAKAFDERLDLSGFVMTKLDGDARGGAALSIKKVTGKPIKFLGMGEDLARLEEFRPEGLASRILGMGDIVGLMEDFDRVSDKDSEQDAMRLLSGKFNFKDFYKQISMIQKMGSLKDIIAKMPMQNLIPKEAQVDDRELFKIKSMIDSMTEKERLVPDLIDRSRAARIARGSGRSVQDISELLGKFKQMRQLMGQMKKGLPGMMGGRGAKGGMPGMGGGMPDLGGLMPQGMSSGGSLPAYKRVDRDKVKKARKSAKQNRKKNRKK